MTFTEHNEGGLWCAHCSRVLHNTSWHWPVDLGNLTGARHCPPCHLTTSQWSGQSRLGTPVGAIGHPRCGEVIREAWGQLREHSQYLQEMGWRQGTPSGYAAARTGGLLPQCPHRKTSFHIWKTVCQLGPGLDTGLPVGQPQPKRGRVAGLGQSKCIVHRCRGALEQLWSQNVYKACDRELF